MKKLLLLLLVPSFLLSQTEKEEKLLFKNNSNFTKSTNSESTDKQEIQKSYNYWKKQRFEVSEP